MARLKSGSNTWADPYVVFCWPGSSLAQTDSTAVAAIREDIERLERDLTGCENQTAEFARLFSFFPPPLTWVDGVEPTGSLSYHHHNRTRGE